MYNIISYSIYSAGNGSVNFKFRTLNCGVGNTELCRILGLPSFESFEVLGCLSKLVDCDFNSHCRDDGTSGRASIRSYSIKKVRVQKLYVIPLNSSTDFVRFNFNTSQLDYNFNVNLISNVFICNFKLFGHSIISVVTRKVCVQDRKLKVSVRRPDAMQLTRGALKCRTSCNDMCQSESRKRHSSGPASHFEFPIILRIMICLPVISYVYYNFIIIKNVIPKIGLKFLHTSVIAMPFNLIFYPLSGFYISLGSKNSYSNRSFNKKRSRIL